MQAKGIDVSTHQGEIDWARAKASGIEFAMLRACYGWDNDEQIDRRFKANVEGCKAAGLPFGMYHYSYAENVEDARKEAAFFLRVISGLKPEYPVAFDFEEPNQLKLPLDRQLEIIEAFMSAIEAAGYYVVLYMSASALQRLYDHAPERMQRYDRWVAHVGVDKPSFTGSYGLWQYSWKGRVDGITGEVDLDYAYKDYPAIIKANGLNGWGQPKPEPVDYKALYEVAKAEVISLAARAEKAEIALAEAEEKLKRQAVDINAYKIKLHKITQIAQQA